MPAASTKVLASGARVVIRDEEWMVRSVSAAAEGGRAVRVTGVSELVRGKEAIFLTELDDIEELRPEETRLVHDDSPSYRRSRLYLESLLRRTPPTDASLYVGHHGAFRRTTYQLQPAAKALAQLRPRILMADGVGLGKTVEVGVLLSELIQRGRGDRILVVALKSILAQFQEELWARFTIPLVRLDSVGIQRVQSRIPSSMNPFYYFDKVIISIDTLKKDRKYRRYLEDCQWDAVVVDECQHVAVRSDGSASKMAQRARLAQLLARTTDALILTSATPHDGRQESFASLINLLEPTAIADTADYHADEVRDHFLRRFKKDIRHELVEAFQERRLELDRVSASPAEDLVFDALSRLELRTIGRDRGSRGILFRTLLLKAFLSSPAACSSTIANRLAHKDVSAELDPAAEHDRLVLGELKALVDAVKPADFRKYQALLTALGALGFGEKGSAERIVIFSERIDTLGFLAERLKKDLKLPAHSIETFHGSLEDTKQTNLVKRFGTKESLVRILLASDAAAEGINLHYFCHRMVHFDLPWSLITLEQRNGRIDRFGQTHEPRINYLLTLPGDPKLAGDLRVLERLIEKEQHAHKNLGDVAWLLDLHDSEREEERIAQGIEEHEPPEVVIPDEPRGQDFLALFLGDEASSHGPTPVINEPLRLFKDDLAYAREAAREVLVDADAIEWHEHLKGFTLTPPDDLLKRFETLPAELRAGKSELKLTVDRQRVMDALDDSRQDASRWPEWQLFWEQHPVAGWLNDRVLARFARHEAPVLRIGRGLEPGERALIFQGVVSNLRSQPILVDWFAVIFAGRAVRGVEPLKALVERSGLDRETPNPAAAIDPALLAALEKLLPAAVIAAREHMSERRQERAVEIGDELRQGLRKLTEWRKRALAAIDAEASRSLEQGSSITSPQRKRLERSRQEVEGSYTSRKLWIDSGMRTVAEPYLRVAAALVPLGDG